MLYLCLILGTPATVSQLAKDVCTFLKWAAGENTMQISFYVIMSKMEKSIWPYFQTQRRELIQQVAEYL